MTLRIVEPSEHPHEIGRHSMRYDSVATATLYNLFRPSPDYHLMSPALYGMMLEYERLHGMRPCLWVYDLLGQLRTTARNAWVKMCVQHMRLVPKVAVA
jgi:hypothetical protein